MRTANDAFNNGSKVIPAAYASHPLVQRYANDSNWINCESTETGKKPPVSLYMPSGKDEMHVRPHLQRINSHNIENGIPFLEAYAIIKGFPRCGIGFIPVGTSVACLDLDLKGIEDSVEREAVLAAHLKLCEEFDTFAEQSVNKGFHVWFELTSKDGLEDYKRIDKHREAFINYNYVTINPDPSKRNGKAIANRRELAVNKFPQLVLSNGHVRNGNAPKSPTVPTGGDEVDESWKIEPTQSDDDVCRAAAAYWECSDKFTKLREERFKEINPDWGYSEADQSFCNYLAWFTDFKKQVAQIWRKSPLGLRQNAPEGTDKTKTQLRDDYVIRTVNNSFDPKRDEKRKQILSAQSKSTTQVPTFIFKLASEYTPRPVEWIAKNYAARRKMTVTAGMPGTGKSTHSVSLAAALSNDEPWPPGNKDNRSRGSGFTLFYSTEEDDIEDTTIPRLIAAGANMDKVIVLEGKRDCDGKRIPFDPAKDAESLLQHVRRYKADIDLLVIDPLIRIVEGNANEAHRVRHALHTINELSRHLNCAANGITHLTKHSRDRHILDRVLSSGAFAQVARIVLNTVQVQNTPEYWLIRSKVSNGIANGGMSYSIDKTFVGDNIETSRIHWNEAIEGDPNELIAKAEGTSKGNDATSQISKARALLLELLMGKPARLFSEIEEIAQQRDISVSALKKAKVELNIVDDKKEFQGPSFWKIQIRNPNI